MSFILKSENGNEILKPANVNREYPFVLPLEVFKSDFLDYDFVLSGSAENFV